MLRRLKAYFFPESLATRAALRRFVGGEAAYVAQRSTYEFSRNTLAWFGQSAFDDPAFNKVFAICRWEAFAAIAADMTVIARAGLAPANRDGRLDEALVRLYADALAEYDVPVHRAQRAWDDCADALASRFANVAAAVAPATRRFARDTGARIHALAPAKSGNDAEERRVLANAVEFGLVAFTDRLERRLDVAATAADLAAGT